MAARTARTARRSAARGGVRAATDITVLVGAIGVALVPLVPVFGVRAIAPVVLAGLALGTVIAVLGTVWRWHAVTVAAAVVVAYVGLGGALAAPSTTVRGVIPTMTTFTSLATATATSWKQILTLQPPLGTGGTLLAAPYLLTLVGSAVVTALTLRVTRPALAALAAIVPAACLVVAIVLGTRRTIGPVATGIGLAAVLVTWAAWRTGALRARRFVALGLLAVVVGGSGAIAGPLVVAGTPRYVVRDEIIPPFDPSAYPSPLSAFRRLVKEKDTVMLTATGLPAGARLRLATLDEFDGVVWNVAGDGSAGGTGEYRRVGETIESSATGPRAQVGIEVGDLSGVWLPTVGVPAGVRFDDPSVAGDLRFNDASGGAVLTRGLTPGLRYTLDVVVPVVPDDATIGEAGIAPVIVGRVTGVPDVIAAKASDIARNAGSPLEVARSLQKALSEGGFFSDGITAAGDYPSLSGHGADRLTGLLGSNLMVGDAEQYASAMALMARERGLPSRVVLGFVPTEEQRAGDVVKVTAGDVDAWVEIDFSGYGWVPFDPTPPRTQTPQEDSKSTPTDPQPQVVQPPPAPPAPVRPPEDDTEQPQTSDSTTPTITTPMWRRVALVAGAVSIPIAVLAAPFLVVLALKARRRRRRRRDRDTVLRVAGGWAEVLDTARDLRTPAPERATRREGAAAIARALTHDPRVDAAVAPVVWSVVAELADEADAVVFGPGLPSAQTAADYWVLVDKAVESMRRAVTWRRRFSSRVSLASLRRVRRPRRSAGRGAGRPLARSTPNASTGPRPPAVMHGVPEYRATDPEVPTT